MVDLVSKDPIERKIKASPLLPGNQLEHINMRGYNILQSNESCIQKTVNRINASLVQILYMLLLLTKLFKEKHETHSLFVEDKIPTYFKKQ